MTRSTYLALLACLLVGIPLGYGVGYFGELDRFDGRIEMTLIEPDALRAHDESYLRVVELICADYFSGSQILRVQAEAKARGESLNPICSGRDHPMPRGGQQP